MQINNQHPSATSILEEITTKANKSFTPFSVLLELTRHCNLRCRHCYRIEDDNREEMPLVRIMDLIDELRQAGCLFLTISGGEPLTHPSFLEICRKANSSNMAIHIFTNGTLITKSLVEKLSSLNIMDIHISIYGATPETHDRITRQNGSYKKTINAALILKQSGLNIRFKYIMMKDNIGDYKDMLGLSEQMNIPYDIDPVITPRDNGDATPTGLSLQDADLRRIYKDMLPKLSVLPARPVRVATAEWVKPKLKSISHITNASNGVKMQPCSATAATQKDNICSFGRSYCAINSYGDIYPCIQLPVSAGNIQNRTFEEVWRRSKYLQEIRNYCLSKNQSCADCESLSYCNQCPGMNYLETKSIYGVSPETCRHTRIIRTVIENNKNINTTKNRTLFS